MKQQAARQTQGLKDAFHLFNQVSEQLATTYLHLENRIGQLHEQLAAARSEKMAQLADKELLANRLERLLEALPAGVVVIDGNGIVQQSNGKTVGLVGEPLVGCAWHHIIDRAFSSSGSCDEAVLRDGRIVSISTSPLGDEPGQIIMLLDVTETRLLQEMLNRHQRLSAMGEMSASLAHQIRTPLASSLLYLSHLKQSQLSSEDYRRCVDKILSRLRHLDKLVNDMMVFAKGSQAGRDEIEMSSLLNELQLFTEPHLATHHCTMEINDACDGVIVQGNHNTLLSVLQNIVLNAVQACADNHGVHRRGRIKISAGQDQGNQGVKTIVILISDNGPGIPTDIKQKIFEPFFTTKPQGTGLGLAVVQAVVHAHNGTLWVDSTTTNGTTVGIRLPVYRNSPDSDESELHKCEVQNL